MAAYLILNKHSVSIVDLFLQGFLFSQSLANSAREIAELWLLEN